MKTVNNGNLKLLKLFVKMLFQIAMSVLDIIEECKKKSQPLAH